MEQKQELSEEEKEQIKDALGFGATIPEEKHNIHSFLNKIATAPDTTKVGYLKSEELGNSTHTLRTYKEVGLIARKIRNRPTIAEYFDAKAEIMTATSLSRGGFLAKLAVLQKREIADVSEDKEKKENSGWFKKKQTNEDEIK